MTQLREAQIQRLEQLLGVLPSNAFYAEKFQRAGLDLARVRLPDEWVRLPFTTKSELLADQAEHPPYGRNRSYRFDAYSRFNQTSGTSGKPLRWLDTVDSWSWVLDCWSLIYDVVGVRPGDRLFFPFSFGPFLGFWSAFESACRRGLLCLPGGGMSSTTRLNFLLTNEVTHVLCTPTYALHLGEVAKQEGIDLRSSCVRALIVAGEPGGSIPATRQRIEEAWGARLFDHHGMTEMGPCSVECPERPGSVHLLETEYVGEILDPDTHEPVEPGTPGELVLTNLGRLASPLLRYRTGDLVTADPTPCPCGRDWLTLAGGIRSRVDEMIVLRGNNVYPSAVQTILHRFEEVVEFRIEVDETKPLADMRIEVELTASAEEHHVTRIERTLRDELMFRVEVHRVEVGALPRFDMKARRVVRKTKA